MVSANPPFEQETARWSGARRRRPPAGLGVPMSLGKARASSAGADKSYLHREPQAHSSAPTAAQPWDLRSDATRRSGQIRDGARSK